MTVESTGWHVTYSGNGSTDDFAVPFPFLANTDLLVVITDATETEYTKTLYVDYTVSGAGDEAGGNVHMLVAPADGVSVDIYRIPSLLQQADLEHNDSLPSTTLERMSDLLTMSVQHLHTLVKRSLRFSFKDGEIDEKRIEDAKGKYPYFNASGDLTFVTGTPSQPLSHSVSLYYPTNGQTVIPVDSGYSPGTGNLSVYKKGTGKLFLGEDYTETSSTSITLVTPSGASDVLEFDIGEVYDVSVAQSSYQSQKFDGGLTGNTITLTTITYTPGVSPIEVIVNGDWLQTFTQTNSTTITLPFNLITTDVVTVIIGRVVDTVAIPLGSVTSDKLASTLDLSGKALTLPNGVVDEAQLAANLDLSAKTVTLPATSVTNGNLSLSANASAIKTALNASGNPPIYACRAWGNLNGTGTPALRASGNCASVTDNGVGDWTIAFTTAMPDANYAVTASGFTSAFPDNGLLFTVKNQAAAGFTLHCVTADGVTEYDADYINFAVFR